MARVEICTQPWCGCCLRTVRLLQSKGQSSETDLDAEPEWESEMTRRSPARTVPAGPVGAGKAAEGDS